MRLGLGQPVLLVIRLGLRHFWGSVVVMVVGRGVGGNGSVERVDVCHVVGGSPNPLDFLYAGLPNIPSCSASLDSNHNEGDDISKNYKGSGSTWLTRSSLLRSLRSIELT